MRRVAGKASSELLLSLGLEGERTAVALLFACGAASPCPRRLVTSLRGIPGVRRRRELLLDVPLGDHELAVRRKD